MLIAGWVLLIPTEYESLGKSIVISGSFLNNFFQISDVNYFSHRSELNPVLHLWSLTLEWQFYLIYPVILIAGLKLTSSLLRITSILLVCTLCINLILYISYKNIWVNEFYDLVPRLWEFIWGGWIYAFGMIATKLKLTRLHKNVLVGILIILLIMIVFINYEGTITYQDKIYASVLVVGALMLLLDGDNDINVLFFSKVFGGIGLFSYSLYLVHWPVFAFFRIYFDSITLKMVIPVIAITFAISYLVYILIERPSSIFFKRHSIYMLLLLWASLILFAYIVLIKKGYDSRMASNNLSQIVYKPASNDICREHHPYSKNIVANEPICLEIHSSRNAKNVYLIGDSHLEPILLGLKSIVSNKGSSYNFIGLGKPGCAPFSKLETYLGKENFGCKDFFAKVFDEIGQDPEVKAIFLAGRFAQWYESSGFGIANSYYGEIKISLDESNHQSSRVSFESSLNLTIERLEKSGVKVFIVHQAPELGFSPRACLYSIYRSYDSCFINLDQVKKRQSGYRDIVNKSIQNNRNVYQLDLVPLFCNSRNCFAKNSEGQLLYRDDNHLNEMGGARVAEKILEVLK